MNLENLSEGQVVKNYKEMCALLSEEIKTGNAKKYQLKDWERYFSYHKVGHKFVIDEIYNEPVVKIRQNNAKYTDLTIHMSELCKFITNDFGHDITLLCAYSTVELEWLCTKCNNTHIKSINQVNKINHTLCSECVLSKGASKVNKLLRESLTTFEREIKFDDLRSVKGVHLRFDFGIYHEDSLIGLIEYDGGYHDCKENVQRHDKMKNEYCKLNNIPLLRIHHTEDEVLTLKLYKFLKEINCHTYSNIDIDDCIVECKRKIEHHQNEINKLKQYMEGLTD